MGIGKRIKKARESLGLTQNELGELVGVTGSAITNYEKETSHPKEPIMYKLLEVLKVDANYLFQDVVKIPAKKNDVSLAEYDIVKRYRLLDVHGKDIVDTILKKETERMEKYGNLDNTGIVTLLEIQSYNPSAKVIPYWEVGVAAGGGIYQLNDTESVPIKLFLTPTTAKADFVVNVKGESMSPDFCNGDKVLVSQRDAVRRGDVGIFIKNGEAYIKELGEMELISRNSEYPNIAISDYDNVVCLGKVIGKLTNDMIAED